MIHDEANDVPYVPSMLIMPVAIELPVLLEENKNGTHFPLKSVPIPSEIDTTKHHPVIPPYPVVTFMLLIATILVVILLFAVLNFVLRRELK